MDKLTKYLGSIMIIVVLYVAIKSKPPVGDAVSSIFHPGDVGALVLPLITLLGGSCGGYITFSGKLDLTTRDKAGSQIFSDADLVMKVIEEFDGVLPFNDKAAPEVIAREFKLSKNAFKRAVGHLLKEGKIEITEKSIRKIDK